MLNLMSRPHCASPAHTEFLGLRFSLLPFEATLRLILESCEGPYAYVVTPNAHHVVTVHGDLQQLLPIYRGAWLSLCDSQIVRALGVLHDRIPLVTGSDLVAALLEDQNAAAPKLGRKRILVVGPPRSSEFALRQRYPDANIRVMQAPDGLSRRHDLRDQVARTCVAEDWDILFLCVGCPAQELIAHAIAAQRRRSGIALCVGAAIDFVTGQRSRAPRWLQRAGLEWAYRLAAEPRRLWRRYLVEAPRIFAILLATRREDR